MKLDDVAGRPVYLSVDVEVDVDEPPSWIDEMLSDVPHRPPGWREPVAFAIEYAGDWLVARMWALADWVRGR